jgi:hypothetical protein
MSPNQILASKGIALASLLLLSQSANAEIITLVCDASNVSVA